MTYPVKNDHSTITFLYAKNTLYHSISDTFSTIYLCQVSKIPR